MHTQVKTTDCTLSSSEAQVLERRMARIERLLPHADADLLTLHLVLQRHPRRTEYRCSLRLTMKDAVLTTTRQRSPAVRTLLTEAFDRLEAQLKRRREERLDRRTRPVEGDLGATIAR